MSSQVTCIVRCLLYHVSIR